MNHRTKPSNHPDITYYVWREDFSFEYDTTVAGWTPVSHGIAAILEQVEKRDRTSTAEGSNND